MNSAGYTLMGYSLASGAGASPTVCPVWCQSYQRDGAGRHALNVWDFYRQSKYERHDADWRPVCHQLYQPVLGRCLRRSWQSGDLEYRFSKTGANTWQVNVYNAASPATPLTTQTLTFDPTTGNQLRPRRPRFPSLFPRQYRLIEYCEHDAIGSPLSVSTATIDGNAPSEVQSVSIGTDGTLSYVYANGKTVPAYSIPLGNVISPDNLTNITSDVFQVSSEFGSLVIGTAGLVL